MERDRPGDVRRRERKGGMKRRCGREGMEFKRGGVIRQGEWRSLSSIR
jgi:hypothetical protein